MHPYGKHSSSATKAYIFRVTLKWAKSKRPDDHRQRADNGMISSLYLLDKRLHVSKYTIVFFIIILKMPPCSGEGGYRSHG